MMGNGSLRVLLEVELCVMKLTGTVKDVGKVKGVPDWLNSSLWSSRPSNSSLSRGYNGSDTPQGNTGASAEDPLQQTTVAVPVPEDPLLGNAVPDSRSSTEGARSSGLGLWEPDLILNADTGNRENIQTERETAGKGIKEAILKSDESLGHKNDCVASGHIDNPLADSWTPSDLDLPSVAGHSSPPQFSNLQFKRSSSVDVRRGQFYTELSKKVINLPDLQRLASQGIPDSGGLRPTVWKANAEADTFFCFVELLSDFRDHFCQQLDNSVVGIRSTIANLTALLKKHDEELWRHLEVTTKVLKVQLTNEMDPFFFYSLEVSEEDFQTLKVEQCILVDFFTFPYKFIELLEHCIDANNHDGPTPRYQQ